ncbi:MAG: hypothetical protein ACRCR2_08045 [Fusobacteriaceae bacterium]
MLNPIIIIGMDNTGKTTLVSNLETGLNNFIETVKESVPSSKFSKAEVELIKSPGPLDRKEMHNWCYDQIIRFGLPNDKVRIYDRFGAIDEQIYAPIVRGNNNIDHVQFLTELIKTAPLGAKPLFIYARPHKDKILGFEDGREQMKGVIENGAELLTAYDELYFQLLNEQHNVMVYDYTRDNINDVLAWYMSFIDSETQLLNYIHVPEAVGFLESTDLWNPGDIDNYDLTELRSILLDARSLLSAFTNLFNNMKLTNAKLTKGRQNGLLMSKLKIAKSAVVINEAIITKL